MQLVVLSPCCLAVPGYVPDRRYSRSRTCQRSPISCTTNGYWPFCMGLQFGRKALGEHVHLCDKCDKRQLNSSFAKNGLIWCQVRFLQHSHCLFHEQEDTQLKIVHCSLGLCSVTGKGLGLFSLQCSNGPPK